MMTMKYIVTEDEEGTEEIFIFPKKINHDCMMEMLARIKDQTHGSWNRVRRMPIAAGFTDCVTCWGRSETLGLDSRKDKDAKLINKN
jgi:hypothetical protein